MEIIDNIPIKIDVKAVQRKLHLKREEDMNNVQQVADSVEPFLQPKAMYNVCYIEKKLEDMVMLNGLPFRSKVLRKNLDQVERVFAYVVTIGEEFDEKITTCDDLLDKFYLDTIGNVALRSARKHLRKHLLSKYAVEGMSFMSPGSLTDWPIEEQKPLFSLIGDVEAAIGVKLTNTFLMLPTKSVSGIFFPTEISFYSCQLCPREKCDGRKAPYDDRKAKEYGMLK